MIQSAPQGFICHSGPNSGACCHFPCEEISRFPAIYTQVFVCQFSVMMADMVYKHSSLIANRISISKQIACEIAQMYIYLNIFLQPMLKYWIKYHSNFLLSIRHDDFITSRLWPLMIAYINLCSKSVMCESESGFKVFWAGFGFGFRL